MLDIIADGQGELDACLFGKAGQTVQKLIGFGVVIGAGNLVQAVDKNMSDVLIAGIEPANK